MKYAALLTSLLLSAAVSAQAQSTLTLWHIQTQPGAKKIIQDAVDRFTKANPSVKVEVTPIANDTYKTKLKIAVGANDAPCIFTSWGGGPLYEYIKSNQVLDLTPYLKKDAAFKNRFVPASFSAVTFGNKVYGIPSENTSVAVVLYNKALFKQYNRRRPKPGTSCSSWWPSSRPRTSRPSRWPTNPSGRGRCSTATWSTASAARRSSATP